MTNAANDLIVGVSAETINGIIKQVHSKFPGSFTGTVTSGKNTMTWTVVNPPAVNFSKPALDKARSYYVKRLNQPHHRKASYYKAVLDYAEKEGPVFMVEVTGLTMIMSGNSPSEDEGGGAALPPTFDVGLKVRIDVNAEKKKLGVVIYEATKDKSYNTDPGTEAIFVNNVLPCIKDALNGLLSGLDIPILTLNNPKMNVPAVRIADNFIYLEYTCVSAFPRDTSEMAEIDADRGVVIMLSNRFVKEAVDASKKFPLDKGDHGKSKAGPLFAAWEYSLHLDKSSIDIYGNGIRAKISSRGKAGAKAGMEMGCGIPPLSVGVGLKMGLTNDPYVDLEFRVDAENNVKGVVTNVTAFSVYCKPDGSVVSWLVGALASLVLNPIIMSAAPAVSGLLKGISFSLIKIESSSLKILGKNVTFTPANLGVTSGGIGLCISGDINVKIS